ncbi:hypothetical protein Q5H91_15500 [Sphingomonas sp. KR1UV-12]|uniref:ATP-binding protein n=1 Tax=Sphingomonas aurea TaxID=3063994 RepID=A0ABT9EPR1_9SPHN|nr:hypothetical protein [Sphingomonas sp. KR1UV-12]MDP1028628.1 hypothetical protein [Sphingomonas sp. KR1UV-12]
MAIAVSDLQFGEADAKNEVFQQGRYGSMVFRNAFLIPPRIDIDALLLGARFFISGQKGCGKTALLLHTQQLLAEHGAHTHIILFKSGVREAERAKLASGNGVEILLTGDPLNVEYDYSTNWLWFIYRNILRLIQISDVAEGVEIADDLRRLTGVATETKNSTFSDLAMSRVKGSAKAGVKAGPFSGEITAEVEAVQKNVDDRAVMDIIEIVERYLPKIKMKMGKRCLLFFDELELFWNRPDQRERDLFLIRDLLQSVARVNRILGATSASFVVYASVRSEVLEEVNRVGPEIVRDITDFGVSVSWNVKGDAHNQPILGIVETKINASEVEVAGFQTDDVWEVYFPESLYGKSIKDYLLDISMFKPRNLVSRLNLAKAYNATAERLEAEAFEETVTDFSQAVWREIEEELLGVYTPKQVSNLKAMLTGFRSSFKIADFAERVKRLGAVDPSLTEGFRSQDQVLAACRGLYRVGAIGNSYAVRGERGQKVRRDRWSFRDMGEPAITETFIVHESLRKVFQLAYGS